MFQLAINHKTKQVNLKFAQKDRFIQLVIIEL